MTGGRCARGESPVKGQVMRKAFVGLALLSCAAIAVSPALANHSWGNYHWARSSNPLSLKIERQLSAAKWVTAYNTAVADWDKSDVLSLTRSDTNLGVSSRKCSAITGKAMVCNDHYGQRGWLGIASIWADGQSHITKATTKLNDSYFNSPTYNTSAWIALVTCQEIGHDFGLDHQDENFNNANLGTCMDYTNSPGTNQHPNAHDYEELGIIYAHLDSYGTASSQLATNFGIRTPGGRAPAAPVADNESGDSPAEWGRAIHNDGAGRPDVFVKDLGAGHKKITHVFWAIGEGPKGGHHDE
jgi:hypothetical protein